MNSCTIFTCQRVKHFNTVSLKDMYMYIYIFKDIYIYICYIQWCNILPFSAKSLWVVFTSAHKISAGDWSSLLNLSTVLTWKGKMHRLYHFILAASVGPTLIRVIVIIATPKKEKLQSLCVYPVYRYQTVTIKIVLINPNATCLWWLTILWVEKTSLK